MADTARNGGEGRRPWLWVPSLYFAQGIPYVVVMSVAVVLYKRLGLSNTDIALYTSWLYLPWVIKPLWSPFVDLLGTRRFWIVATQLLLGAGLAGVALTIPASSFFRYTLAIFWLMAFLSATHDIAADGFYMLGLSENRQAYFVGIRSTFYRLSMITGQGLLVMLAGWLEDSTGLEPVHLEVVAKTAVGSSLPGVDFAAADVAPDAGELRIVTSSESLELGIGKHDPREVAALRMAIAEWNHQQGFALEPVTPVVAGSKPVGTLGLTHLRLSKPPDPGQEVVVHVGHEAGDQSIGLVDGSRLRFTSDNWQGPALVAFELDHRLRADTVATFEARAGNVPLAWSITFLVLAGLFLLLFGWHRFVLPRPATDVPGARGEGPGFLHEFVQTFVLFFKRQGIWTVLAFLLLYRFGEAQLVKLAAPFLLDATEVGGLGLTTGQVGFVYGTVGVICLTLGGILGGIAVSRHGLRAWLLAMVVAINLPDVVYIYLSFAQPESFVVVNLCVGIEQFGYGFGFTAYMMYMIYASRGAHKTAHYAICTGFMALGMMIPGMFSGWLQEAIGYRGFFVWVLIATLPAFVIAALVKVEPEFGRRPGG